MKFCFNSSQFFACSGDVLSNHLLATPTRVRGNTRRRAESFVLNRLATSSTFPICSIAFSVELHEKVVLRNSLKIFPLISNVAFSGLLILPRVFIKSIDVVDWSRRSVSSSLKLSFRIGEQIITEYLVNISKRRAFWSLNEDILKINDSDYQYAVSIKEDTAYPCLHSPKTTKERRSIRHIQRRQIRRIGYMACEYSGRYQRGPYSKKPQYADILIRASRLKKVMADKGKKSSIETFAPNDKADYYSRITSITVGKFLDDLHNNAFSGTNGKDAVEHIEYYLKIIDPIKLPNVDHDKLRVVALS
ncbi:hypothetical protein Tco_0110338 [Tanacetum coccineum]